MLLSLPCSAVQLLFNLYFLPTTNTKDRNKEGFFFFFSIWDPGRLASAIARYSFLDIDWVLLPPCLKDLFEVRWFGNISFIYPYTQDQDCKTGKDQLENCLSRDSVQTPFILVPLCIGLQLCTNVALEPNMRQYATATPPEFLLQQKKYNALLFMKVKVANYVLATTPLLCSRSRPNLHLLKLQYL